MIRKKEGGGRRESSNSYFDPGGQHNGLGDHYTEVYKACSVSNI